MKLIGTFLAASILAAGSAHAALVITGDATPVTDIGTTTANSTGITPYASDGYFLFATGSGQAGDPTYTDVNRLPSYVSNFATSAGAASGYPYADVVTPQNGTVRTGTLTDGAGNKFSFSLTNPTSGSIPSSIRIGLLVDNLDSTGYNASGFTVSGTNAVPATVSEADGNRNPDLYFFTLTGATAGDVITVSATSGTFGYGTVSGVTFATAPVPEPASLSLLGVGGGVGLLSRRRR